MAPCHLAALVGAAGVEPAFALACMASSGRRPGPPPSSTCESNTVFPRYQRGAPTVRPVEVGTRCRIRTDDILGVNEALFR